MSKKSAKGPNRNLKRIASGIDHWMSRLYGRPNSSAIEPLHEKAIALLKQAMATIHEMECLERMESLPFHPNMTVDFIGHSSASYLKPHRGWLNDRMELCRAGDYCGKLTFDYDGRLVGFPELGILLKTIQTKTRAV
jgi:hypothetical protein